MRLSLVLAASVAPLVWLAACVGDDPTPTGPTTDASVSEGGGSSSSGGDSSAPIDGGDGGPATTCGDNALNGDETDVDCGGSCTPCANTKICKVDKDCATGLCSANKCAPWQAVVPGAQRRDVMGVAVDPSGAVVLGGGFAGTINFSASDPLKITAESFDGFVAKVDSKGGHVWQKRLGGPAVDYVYDVATDAKGDVYAVGSFEPGAVLGATTVPATVRHLGVVKLAAADGAVLWAKVYDAEPPPPADSRRMMAITVDGAGRAIVAASFRIGNTFGGAAVLEPSGEDVVLLALAPDGSTAFAKRYGGANNDYAQAVAVDASDNVYFGGSFAATLSVKDSLANPGVGECGFVASVDKNGVARWARRIYANNPAGVAAGQQVRAVATDAAGRVHVVGLANAGQVRFGGPPAAADTNVDIYASGGGVDAYYGAYSGGGDFIHGALVGGIGDDYFHAVKAVGTSVVVYGYFGPPDVEVGVGPRRTIAGSEGPALFVFPQPPAAGKLVPKVVHVHGLAGQARGRGLAIRPGGGVVVAGHSFSTATVNAVAPIAPGAPDLALTDGAGYLGSLGPLP